MPIVPMLAVLLITQTPALDDARAGAETLAAMDSASLARLLLPSSGAARIVHHAARAAGGMRPSPPPGVMPAVAVVELFTEAELVPEGVCRREIYRLEARRTSDGTEFAPTGPSQPRPQIRLDPDCAGLARRVSPI